jgi:enamine deaminase RidA (YjgF/YER057c/UK114 family)
MTNIEKIKNYCAVIWSYIKSCLLYKKKHKTSMDSGEVAYINPPDLSKPLGYSHITTATLNNSRIVCIAGQASLDSKQENVVVGIGDLETQAKNSYTNLGIALTAVGASPRNVLKSNIYTTINTQDSLSIILKERENFFKECPSPPPGALIGVPFLALDGLMIEVDAEAIVPNSNPIIAPMFFSNLKFSEQNSREDIDMKAEPFLDHRVRLTCV